MQLTPDFGFADVEARLHHYVGLGISHVYLSPVAESMPGSTHGYDVVDHTRVRAELGDTAGLWSLLDAAHAAGLSLLIDHVPNHASVARPELNRPWWTMLREGPDSAAARWFDIDWAAADGRVILPALADPLDDVRGAFTVADGDGGPELRLGEQRWPLAVGTEHRLPAEAVDRQHYQLVQWHRPERNVRRFFTIDDLVAVCVEHPDVAEAVDTIPRLLAEHPAFGGARVDHVDGLADPAAYLQGLRRIIGDERWLVVEKILAPSETLPANWPVDGTTGYEHARLLEHALVDRRHLGALATRWAAVVDDFRPFHEWELAARRQVLDDGLTPDVERVANVAKAAGIADVGEGPEAVVAAVVELSVHLARYRTYLPDDPEGLTALAQALTSAVAMRPSIAVTLDRLTSAITAPTDGAAVELRTRWQQLTGPAMAKGVEDRTFFRYGPLSSLCEVGGDPAPHSTDPVDDLHRHHDLTQRRQPTTLLVGTTHDTKRSEDVRARGLALGAVATDRWQDVADRWFADRAADHADVDPAMQWLALQTVAMAAPITPERLAAFLVKCAREADMHTSWSEPSPGYESALARLSHELAGPTPWPPLVNLVAEIERPGRAVSLAMLAVRLTAPGVPDVYQGTEAFRLLLVDPDNRTHPDAAELTSLVERSVGLDGAAAWAEPGSPAARAVVLRRLLAIRRRLSDVFGADGRYRPLPASASLLAFARLDRRGMPRLITVVARAEAPIEGSEIDVELALPSGEWRHVLLDDEPPAQGSLDVGASLGRFPAVVLVT